MFPADEKRVGVGLALPRMVEDRSSQGTASRPPTIVFHGFRVPVRRRA